jgi:hypothetical protein
MCALRCDLHRQTWSRLGGLNTGMRYFRSPSFHRHRPRLAGGYCAVERCAADQRSELQGCSVLRRSPLCTGVCVPRGQQCSRKTLLSNECGHGFFFVPTSSLRNPNCGPISSLGIALSQRCPNAANNFTRQMSVRQSLLHPSNSRCAPKLWRINWSAKVSQARMLRLRRKAASFSNSNIKWPARFHGLLPHPCKADLAAIPLLIARRGVHFSVKQRRPSLHAARGTDA